MKTKKQRSTINQNKSSTLKLMINKYDPKIASIFLPWACKNPRYLRSFLRLKCAYLKSEKSRVEELANGLKIPPFLILSITPKCNLSCKGCYAAAAGNIYTKENDKSVNTKKLLNLQQWQKIISDAGNLGVFGFVLAGGEPFLFPELLKLCKKFKDRFFIILTNGTTLRTEDYDYLKRLGNVAVLVSIEGGIKFTNERRGQGVYEKALNTIKQLNKNGVICGISATITRLNYKYWMDSKNIDDLISQGIRIGVFIEYIPITPEPNTNTTNQILPSCSITSDSLDDINYEDINSDHKLILTPKEREMFRSKMLNYRETKSIYIVHTPGDEEFFGGCVSAGRGFAHVTPAGDLTPCPISNIATHNLKTSTLREALASPLFKKIRENEHLLETEGLPCALFAHQEEVNALAKSVGAYQTDFEKKCH